MIHEIHGIFSANRSPGLLGGELLRSLAESYSLLVTRLGSRDSIAKQYSLAPPPPPGAPALVYSRQRPEIACLAELGRVGASNEHLYPE